MFVELTSLKENCSPKHKASNKNLKQITNEMYSTLNEYFIETPHLVDCLFHHLINSRYGLKEIEILDLLYLSALNLITVYKMKNSICSPSLKALFNYTVFASNSDVNMSNLRSFASLIWYTFKYNYFLKFSKHKLLLFKSYIHNHQLYYCFYDLSIKRKFYKYFSSCQNQPNNCEELSVIDKRLIYDYFNLRIDKLYHEKLNSGELPVKFLNKNKSTKQHHSNGSSYIVLNKLRVPVTEDTINSKLNEISYQRILSLQQADKVKDKNFVTYRMYQEVSLHYYNNHNHDYRHNSISIMQNQNSSLSEQHFQYLDGYFKEYLFNFEWFLNKIKHTKIWFYIDDLEFCKYHIQQLSQCTDSNIKLKQLCEEFYLFEKCLYKILYALNNDIHQIYVQFYQALNLFEAYNYLNDKYSRINNFFTNMKQYYGNNSILYPINIHVKSNSEINENIFTFGELVSYFNEEKINITFASYIKNLESYVITFSKVKNEIKIWNVKTLNIVRTIKLNKSPKDIRFIDSYKCVLLVDRNLHLFDLNKCEQLNDLRTMLDKSMQYFELHDENTIVFLDRNRLSVTMMKLPSRNENQPKIEATQQETVDQARKVKPKQHQFKAGEDRFMNSLMVSKNGKIMVCGDETQKPFPLIVWNLFEQKLIFDFRKPNHEFETSIQSITTSGKYVICANKVFFAI